jgi:hypothetical protein
VVCDDGNACTDDACDPATGQCVFTNDDTNSCSDGNACTQTDSCQAGACVGGNPVICDDGNACTDDACDPATGQCVFTNDDTNSCSDGNACTQTDSCQGGVCVGGNPVVCDDGNACTDDACDPATGQCVFTNDDTNSCSDGNACTQTDSCQAGVCVGGNPVVCDDGNACTDDVCDPATGQCVFTNDDTNACSDGNACTQTDSCQAGVCVGGNPVVCDDGNACTDDACNPATGQCVFTNDDTNACSDGNACTQTDSCQDGVCVGGNAVVCDDGNACTDDACDPATGQCVFTNDDTNSCSDENACTQTDSCQAGACVGGNPVVCDDGNACTDDACNPATGQCVFTNDDTNACSDGNACTQTDSCQAGACVGGNPVVCDDGKACTDDACNPATGQCVFTNDDTNACSDGNACTQTDTCQAGVCVGGNPVVCDDGNACTDDACNPATGQCVFTNDDTNTCSDGNACTQTDSCANGVCVGGNPKSCNDGNLCTVDQCNPATGQCMFTPVNCSNGLFCDGLETCNPANGACLPGQPPDCDDRNACTLDSCNETIDSCVHLRTRTLVGTDGSGGNLYRIDAATGAAALIGPMGFAAPSIAVDPSSGVLYAGQGAGFPNLYTVDPNTGAATLVGDTGFIGAAVAGLAFDAAGDLYAAVNAMDDGGTGADTLAILDTITGVGVAIGTFGGGIGSGGGPGGIEGIAFDGSGQLYGTSARQSSSDPTAVPRLYTINVSTGVATVVGPLVNASGSPPAGGVVGLEFDSGGSLYGGTGQGTGNLIRINPATGVFVLIGPSVSRSLASLAFLDCGCFGDEECGDGSACTTDRCNLATGACEHPPACDDGNQCTTDSCNPANGQCGITPTPDAPCNDGNACTQDDHCAPDGQSGIACQGTQVICEDDGNVCTADVCDPLQGCGHEPIEVTEPDPIQFESRTTMSWAATPDATHWNTYRGTIPNAMFASRPPGAVYDHVCFESADAFGDGATVTTDTSILPIGTAYYYLHSGEGVCGESDVGHSSSGAAIPNPMACPTPP